MITMKKINVSKLWEDIPAWYILGLFGKTISPHSLPPKEDEIYFVKEIQFTRTCNFVIEDINGKESKIETNQWKVVDAEAYLSNPINLLKFTNLLYDRLLKNREIVEDIDSHFFRGGRKRRQLNEYRQEFLQIFSFESNSEWAVNRHIVDRIIYLAKSDISATPYLAMWILEGIRERYTEEKEKAQEFDYESSDGELYRMRTDSIRISDFPPIYIHDILGEISIHTIPIYVNLNKGIKIRDPKIRERIYYRLPVHSSFLSCSSTECLPQHFEIVAGKIIKFINYHLLKSFNEMISMSLYDAYCSSWIIEEAPAILNYQLFLLRSFIVEGMKRDLSQILEKGYEGSEFLRNTTILEALNNYAEGLKKRRYVII
ncbi:MAG: hypothetical protein FHOMOCKG_00037 [Methanophagales virus GBV302]|uniref:Uncharacterized protein n=1 Tax=Methanophagales virus GBV302 TaxID=2999281 RepID=A0A9E9A8H6_9CAUD|nr:MAG: hypothetical protein QIT37_gp037 [Methanophagales virus GBV302]WAE39565.1 MAG: hypothetical protein FHOMOCKG_00037 [Methanophagales virus GBV302]